MSQVKIVLSMDDYNPWDASELKFKRKNGGWLNATDLKERVEESIEKAIGMMESGDHLTITIEVTPEETE